MGLPKMTTVLKIILILILLPILYVKNKIKRTQTFMKSTFLLVQIISVQYLVSSLVIVNLCCLHKEMLVFSLVIVNLYCLHKEMFIMIVVITPVGDQYNYVCVVVHFSLVLSSKRVILYLLLKIHENATLLCIRANLIVVEI